MRPQIQGKKRRSKRLSKGSPTPSAENKTQTEENKEVSAENNVANDQEDKTKRHHGNQVPR